MLKKKKRKSLYIGNVSAAKLSSMAATALFLVVVFVYIFFAAAPSSFERNITITIDKGSTLTNVANLLDEKEIVKSKFLLKLLVFIRGGDKNIFAGDYLFEKKLNVFSVANRISTGFFNIEPKTITIMEGSTIYDIGDILEDKLVKFDRDHFLKLAVSKEGYLFPDTYNFSPLATPEDVIVAMEDNFKEKIKEVEQEINDFGRPLDEVVIMASLLEKEARTLETRRMIADVLWSRIEIGMALQVDAVFPYILGRNTYEVTLEDLKFDSPYNTYKYPGLPIGPIANPSLRSILAAVTPIENPYLFYLNDRQGVMHYARDFEGHQVNRELHLN